MPMKPVTIILSVNVCVDLSSPTQIENFKALLKVIRAEGLDTEELLRDVEKAAKVLAAARDAMKVPEFVDCKVCGQTFPDPQMLKEHEDEHKPKEEHKCGECDHSLKTRAGLKYHYDTKHPGTPFPPVPTKKEPEEAPEYYRCEHCGKIKPLSNKKRHDNYEKRRGRYGYKPQQDSEQHEPPTPTAESKVVSTVEPDSSEIIAPTADTKDLEECPCGVKVEKSRMGIHQLTREHKDRMAAML